MLKCTMLLPKTDNEGKKLANEHRTILGILYDRFGGHSVEGTTHGTYRMADGSRCRDDSSRVVVVVDTNKKPELYKLVQTFASMLRQETIYFECSLSNVQFVAATPDPAGKVCKASPSEGEIARGLLAGMSEDQPEKPKAGETIGEYSDYFDGRVFGYHQARVKEIAEKAARRGYTCTCCTAGAIEQAVNITGGYEVGGELPEPVVRMLKKRGHPVHVYKHHGTIATVVRPRRLNEDPGSSG